MIISNSATHSFYAVVNDEGKVFAGFDPEKGVPAWVDNVLEGKWFSNKYDIKLRPNEKLVEIQTTVTKDSVSVTEPFRPKRRKTTQH